MNGVNLIKKQKQKKNMFVNHTICQSLKPDSNFGSCSQNSKSSPHHVFSDRIVDSDSFINFLTCSKDLCFPEISVLNLMKFLKHLSQDLQSKRCNNSLLWRELLQVSPAATSNLWVAFPNKFSQHLRKIPHRLAEPTRTCCIIRRCIYLFQCLWQLPTQFMLWQI